MSDESPTYKPGDVANGHVLGDDNQWHLLPASTQPGLESATPQAAVTVAEKPTRHWYAKKRFIIPAAVVLLFVVVAAVSPKKSVEQVGAADTSAATEVKVEQEKPSSTPTPVPDVAVPDVTGQTAAAAASALQALGFTVTGADDGTATVTATTPAAGATASKGSSIALTVQAKPQLTLAQLNAVASAKSYLENLPFSRQGLIDQLSSEYGSGYPIDVATFAVDYLSPDYNAEAAEAAKSYLSTMPFSRDGLYEQLTSAYGAQFTPDQANAGLAAVGY